MTRNSHAGTPFSSTDAEIASALEDVSIPTLLLSLTHITGDMSLLRDRWQPGGLFLNEVQGFMSEEDKADVRAYALGVLSEFRDRGCPEPEPISSEEVHEMMSWIACEEVPDEYVPMLMEELGLDGVDRRGGEAAGGDGRDLFPVVVIGCGQSGLLAGIRLREAGIPFTIVEKNPDVGGTWFENKYPGARVDVGSHFYCYSFEPTDGWSEHFAQQSELQAYFSKVMQKYGVDEHVRWETEVVRVAWDDSAARWDVIVRGSDEVEETIPARAVISAVGQLNRPFVPDLPGADSFAGPSFHTARWDHDVDLTGKRVAMIGAGASGFQVAPAIAGEVDRLAIFQRTAQWMFPNPGYHDPVGLGVNWAIRHLPFYGRWYRFLLFWPGCDAGLAAARVDPEYPDQQHAVSDVNAFAREIFSDWIRSQVGDDPELLAKVMPDYPATGKRTLQDNGSWLQALKRGNVDLVRTGIDHIEADAVVAVDGERYPADVILYATGFRVTQMLWPMDVVGGNGVDLRQMWGDRPAAYLGMTVPGFPNFFLMYGPGTNLAHGGSLIFHSECQMRYISQCLELLIASDAERSTMEPKSAKYDDWHTRTQQEMSMMVWSQPTIGHSFYKNERGEIHGLSPWRLIDYWNWTKSVEPADFTFGP